MRPVSARLTQANSALSGQKDQPSAVTNDLFVYGTLTLDHVMEALIDRVPTHETVTAEGWRMARLPGRPYRGLVHDHGYAPGTPPGAPPFIAQSQMPSRRSTSGSPDMMADPASRSCS